MLMIRTGSSRLKMSEPVKYFHELTSKEFFGLMVGGAYWSEVAKIHPQPEWCQYNDALAGPMGCWPLMARKVTGEDSCEECECYCAKPKE